MSHEMSLSYETSLAASARYEEIGKLVLRLALGGLMLFHGFAKLTGGIDFIADVVVKAGLPSFIAYGVYVGGLTTLVGSLGLLRLRDFFSRMHGPSMTNTVGVGAVLLASMLTTSALVGRASFHELLIALFVLMSAPLTSIMLVQAALYRNKARNSRQAIRRL